VVGEKYASEGEMTKQGRAFAAWVLECALVVACPLSAAEATAPLFEWSELRPTPDTATESNPFDTLNAAQIDALRHLVLSRELEARGAPRTDSALQRRADLVQQLAAQGLDAEALLARREAIIAQRRAAAEAGNPAVEGREVLLGGYLVPVAVAQGRVQEFLLVPWVGACSHADKPPPNQIVRVRPALPQVMGDYYQPAQVEGRLRLQPTMASVFLGDGSVTLRSAYLIDGAALISTQAVARSGP
jgi:uncharacterized protein